MSPRPFLLDPAYESLLDSSAFRQRYCQIHRIKSLPELVPSMMPLILSVILPMAMWVAVMFYVPTPANDPKFKLIFGIVIPIAALVMLLLLVFNVRSEMKRYRMAWQGKLVQGTIDSCTGEEYMDVSDDNPLQSRPYTRIAIQYSVESPSGKCVRGRASVHRYDLRTEQLPAKGTPVCVLMLDEKMYSML